MQHLTVDKYLISKPGKRPRIYRVKSVGAFVELTSWLSGNEDIVFRGQRCARPLLPSVARSPEYIRVETDILAEFKRESIPYLRLVPQTEWQWLAVAQHNRLPTRLLDWTKNALTALWFAVSKPAEGKEPGIVWAYAFDSPGDVHAGDDSDSPFEITRPWLYFPDHVFPFIQSQSGIFTVHPRTKSGKFIPFETECDSGDLRLVKIEVPAAAFMKLRYHLFRNGINPATIFPGLAGLVGRIRYQHEFMTDEQPK